jgi:hypothetical protein
MRVVAAAFLSCATVVGAQQSPYPLRPVTMMPNLGGDNPEAKIGGVGGFLVSKAGRSYVLDSRPCTVRIFDPAGKFLKAFGRAGAGAGQCTRPIGLLMDDTSITILDAGSQPGRGGPPNTEPVPPRRVVFSLEGKALSATTVTMQEFALPRPPLRGGGRLGVGYVQTTRTRLITLMKANATAPDTLFRYQADVATIERAGRSGQGASGFGEGGAFAQSGDSLLVFADGYAGTVKWYAVTEAGAELKRTESMGISGNPITPQDVSDRIEQMAKALRRPPPPAAEDARGGAGSAAGRAGRNAPPPATTDAPILQAPEGLKMSNPPEMTSVATNLMFAADGAVWVSSPRRQLYLTGDPNEKYIAGKVLYTVFPAAGKPYAVRLSIDFWPVKVIGDRVYGYSDLGSGVLQIFQMGAL